MVDRWNCRDCHHTPGGECRAHERDRLNIFKEGLQLLPPEALRPKPGDHIVAQAQAERDAMIGTSGSISEEKK